MVYPLPVARRRKRREPSPMRLARERLNLSQTELALAAGVSPGWVCQCERYPQLLSEDIASKLARALGVKPRDLTPHETAP
jgi:ribosome-binding protein aMBF1 (putative translation factor)